MGYVSIEALAEGIKKAGSTDEQKVAEAMLGMTYRYADRQAHLPRQDA